MTKKQERPKIYAAVEGIPAIDATKLIFASTVPSETLRLVEFQLMRQKWISWGIFEVSAEESYLEIEAPETSRVYKITMRKPEVK
jgi:hypothetical protein